MVGPEVRSNQVQEGTRYVLTTGIQVEEQVVRPIGEDASTPQGTTTLPREGISEASITPTGPTQTWIEQVSASCGALHGSAWRRDAAGWMPWSPPRPWSVG